MKMKTKKQQIARRGGFTLLEILVVVLIIGLLIGVVGTNVFQALIRGQRGTTEMQIKQFEGALKRYRLDNGRYPEALEELAEPDPITNEPYLDGGKVPLDPWKNDYSYQLNPDGSFLIISFGKDGEAGGTGENADITTETIREDN